MPRGLLPPRHPVLHSRGWFGENVQETMVKAQQKNRGFLEIFPKPIQCSNWNGVLMLVKASKRRQMGQVHVAGLQKTGLFPPKDGMMYYPKYSTMQQDQTN